MVTVQQSFSVVRNSITTVNDCWPAVTLSSVGHNSDCNVCFFVQGFIRNNIDYNINLYPISGFFFANIKVQEILYSILGLESPEAMKHSFPQNNIFRFSSFCLVVSLLSLELLNDNQQHTISFPCACYLFWFI